MKYILAIPYFGGIDHEHLACVKELTDAGVQLIKLHGCPYVDHARSFIASQFLDRTDAEVLMWIDHDIIFNAHEVEPMVDRLLASDYAVLGGAYSVKQPHGMIVGAMKDATEAVFYEPGIHEAVGLGMGFTAVKRTALEKLTETLPKVNCPTFREKCWPFYHHIVDDVQYLGEDFSFCQRVRDAGMKVGMDVQPRVWHKGTYVYSLEDCAMGVPSSIRLPVRLHGLDDVESPRKNRLGEGIAIKPPSAAE